MNLQDLSNSELTRIADMFPWFAAVRKELAVRAGRPSEAALYVVNRSSLKGFLQKAEPIRIEKTALQQQVVVVGGDYFSQDEYDNVRQESDKSIINAISEKIINADSSNEEVSYETETLAKIYQEQGYIEEAKNIYSKLSLRYPEKNAYFAALIEKLEKEN